MEVACQFLKCIRQMACQGDLLHVKLGLKIKRMFMHVQDDTVLLAGLGELEIAGDIRSM